MTTTLVQPPTDTSSSRSSTQVLLVDDDSFQLDMITGILQSLGFIDITRASSGDIALNEIAKRPKGFNLLLIDLHMPGMDGFQFMEAVAKQGYNGSLIIVSGQGSDVMHSASLVAKLRRFKLLGVVTKPVARTALSALISNLD